MSDAPIPYTKLPGPSTGWSGRSRLWLAEDHLLEVNSTLFTERYHRFFLHDIRSVIAQRTKLGFYWNVALGSLGGLGLLLAGASYWGGKVVGPGSLSGLKSVEEARLGFWIIGGMFGFAALLLLLALFINILFGPTCRLHIHTTAGTRILAAPTRLRRADRILAQLVPHIEAVQAIPAPTIPS